MNTIKHNGVEYVIERDGQGYGALLAERALARESLNASIVFAVFMTTLVTVIWFW